MSNKGMGNGPAAGPIADAPDGALRPESDGLVERLDAFARLIEKWPPTMWSEQWNDVRAAAARIRELEAQREPGKPDWYFLDMDPDYTGDSAYEAMFDNVADLTPVKIHTSYVGPTLWCVLSPPLPDAGNDDVTAHEFDTEEQASAFCAERTRVFEVAEGSPAGALHPTPKPDDREGR